MAGILREKVIDCTLPLATKIRFGIRHDKIGRGVDGTVGRIEGIDEMDGRHVLVRATVDGERV